MLVLILGIFLLTLLFAFTLKKNKSDLRLPPEIQTFPVIGTLRLFLSNNVLSDFLEIAKNYGPVARTVIGTKQVVILNGANCIKQAGRIASLNGQVDFIFTRILDGKGIIWPDDAKEQRKFVLKTFKDFELKGETTEDCIHDEVTQLLNRVKEHGNKAVPMNGAFSVHTVNTLFRILFGVSIRHDDSESRSIVQRLLGVTHLPNPIKRACFYAPQLAKFLPTSLSGERFVRDFVTDFYSLVEQNIANNLNGRVPNVPRNFTDALMDKIEATSDENSVFHSSQNSSIPILADLLFAAIETTSSTLEWAILFLSQFPTVQKKLQKEIDQVIGREKYGSAPDRLKMPYFQAVLQEIFRIATAIPLGSHKATMDTEFMGYTIKKGSNVISNFYGVHMDPTNFDSPEKFNPERFIDKEGQFVKSDLILTFGSGRRSCLGETLARDQIFIFLTRILQAFEIMPLQKNYSLTGTVNVIGYHCCEYEVVFQPRIH